VTTEAFSPYHPTKRVQDREQLRNQLKDAIDGGGFQRVVVFSAGMGFLAGAYEASQIGGGRVSSY
jgi:hypothetical protein